MFFANPWGLLALLAVPAILAIHLFHRRFPPLIVGGAHLWGLPRESPIAGRKREKLPISLTLLLELLAAILLALLLSQPRLGDWGSATHLVIVLDHSASMRAAATDEPAFYEQALEQAKSAIDDLNRGSRVTVIRTGPRPVTLAGPAARPEQALKSLAEWIPTAAGHDPQSAWDLAAQFAGETGQILFLTDQLPSEDRILPQAMRTIAVGKPLPNVCLNSARRQPANGAAPASVYVRISNLSGTATPVLLKGTVKSNEEKGMVERTVFQRPLTVPPGGSLPQLVEIPSDVGELQISVSATADGLSLDNTAVLPRPDRRIVTYAVDLPANEAAVKQIERVFSVLAGVEPAERDTANLLFATPSPLPPSNRELWWFGVGPLSRTDEARKNAVDLTGPYIFEKDHPLVAGLSLGQLIWRGAQPFDLHATPLIACDRQPLLAQLNGTKTTAFILNGDLTPSEDSTTGRSQLADSENWPILLSNLVELRRDDLPGLRRNSFRVGEVVRFRWTPAEALRLVPEVASATLTERTLAQDARGVVEIANLDEPAVYSVKNADEIVGRFAVNFEDRRESVLTALNSGERAAANSAADAFLPDRVYSWPVIIVLASLVTLLMVNWTVALTAARQ